MRRIRQGVLGAAVAGALGFGGAQVFASPDPPQSAIPCDSIACDRFCQAIRPGPLTTGVCGPEGECLCAL